MPEPALTIRALNRAFLARQMLLERKRITALGAVEAVVGLQAQQARPPFVGLWSRIHGFEREELSRSLHAREIVRATFLRGTLHLVGARDFIHLRGALQPALTDGMRSVLRGRADGLDIPALSTRVAEFLDQEPRPFDAVRAFLGKRFRKGDVRAMAYAVRTHLPLIQVPTCAAWAFPGTADFAVASTWLGKPVDARARIHSLILRYLEAFGPAMPADARTWSGLKGLGDVFEELRPRLRVFRDEHGRELFDHPDAPRPDADTEAPVRFLPEFDNAILSHADRTRIVADVHRPSIVTKNLRVLATFLIDGFVAGTWGIERKGKRAVLTIKPFGALPHAARPELAAEAEGLLRFAEEDADERRVEFAGRSSARKKA